MNGFDNRTGEAQVANESGAWLEFVGECNAAIERIEQGALEPRLTSTLLAAATRLQTRTARVLALTMISRVAGRMSATNPMSISAAVMESSDRLPAPTMNPRVAAVLDHGGAGRGDQDAFNRHLQLARMNTAARLLQTSSLSVKEISAATGYEHVPSFDRQFRKHFRMTPGEFRRGIRI